MTTICTFSSCIGILDLQLPLKFESFPVYKCLKPQFPKTYERASYNALNDLKKFFFEKYLTHDAKHIHDTIPHLHFTLTLLSDTFHLTCHLLYNIDDSNATQTSSLKADNTRETVRGQPPPNQAAYDFYFSFVN